jgi:hypothetical protein
MGLLDRDYMSNDWKKTLEQRKREAKAHQLPSPARIGGEMISEPRWIQESGGHRW